MFRRIGLPAAVIGAAVSLAAVAPPASAGPPLGASCVGVLSAYGGQSGIRDNFAPMSGASVARIAQERGDLSDCITVLLSNP